MEHLIIPMLVEAYASGKKRTNKKRVPRISPNYKTVLANSVLGSRNTPGVEERMDALLPGVHLHFILPDAFTHSMDGEHYPDVPDRYVVTRLWYDERIERMNTKCFIVESNFISTDKKYSNSITIPFFQDANERKKWRYLGRCYSADQMPQNLGNEAYLDGLTCVGAGDVLFASYYPGCRSVFGFHDDLADLPLAESRKLTYYVMGYFSQSEKDPFAGVTDREEFEKLLISHNFSVPEDSELCNRCVLYGAIDGLEWKGFEAEYCPVPQGKVNVVFGNTSAEALSCAVRTSLGEEKAPSERMLTALQYELYDEEEHFDGNFKIDDVIHLNTFTGLEGYEEVPKLSVERNVVSDESIWDTYDTLNRMGEEIGKLKRKQDFDRELLYSVWEQYVMIYEEEPKSVPDKYPDKAALLEEIKAICARIGEQEEELQEKKKRYDSEMQRFCENLPEGVKCNKGGTEPFYPPKEPVLLLSGPGIKRSYAFGEDGRFTSDGTLFCQTKAVTSEQEKEHVFQKSFAGLVYKRNLPDIYTELLFQTILLCEDVYGQVKKLAGELPVKGVLPGEIAVNKEPFTWTTLYMTWGVEYSPTRTYGQEDNTLEDWKYEYGDTNLVYQKGLKPENLEKHEISGKIVLTPHAVNAFSSAVTRYAEIYGEEEELKILAEQICTLPVISQNISGFSSYFSGMWQALQFPVMGIGGDAEIAEAVARCLKGERQSILPESELFPLRGGYVKVKDLALVSSFGQVQTLIESSYYNSCEVGFAETVDCPIEDYGLLPPVFTTPARLLAEFVSASDRTRAVSTAPASSPVCGILIPEMLNRRLLTYTAEGKYLGMIKTVYREGKPQARWLSAPGEHREFNNLQISDKNFKSFLWELIHQEQAFYEFNGLMDEFLGNKQNFGTLIWGRPLVLARMKAKIEFFGSPQISKRYEDFGKRNTYGAEKIRVPLKFGDMERITDGLLGCFEDQNFKRMYPAFGSEHEKSERKYINDSKGIEISNADGERYFTVLMEPDSPIHLQTGLFPVKTLYMEPVHTKTAGNLSLSAEISPVLSPLAQTELPVMPETEKGSIYMWYTPKEESYLESALVPPMVSFEEITLLDGFLVKEKKNEA